jgi:hypothetical protein
VRRTAFSPGGIKSASDIAMARRQASSFREVAPQHPIWNKDVSKISQISAT